MVHKSQIIELTYPHRTLRIKIEEPLVAFRPSRVSILVAKTLTPMDGEKVIDIGTGSGFLAIVASKLGATSVVATDVSTGVLRCAARNARLNGVSNIDFRVGSCYAPVKGMRFNAIICNPPQIPYPEPLDKAVWGGRDGRHVINEVIDRASKFLESSGKLLLPVLSMNNLNAAKRRLEGKGFIVESKTEDIQPFGPKLFPLLGYIKTLKEAEIIWIDNVPHWKCVVFQGTKLHKRMRIN
jgi:release factor glutamine methyltransferase